jgi:hypothetical protein
MRGADELRVLRPPWRTAAVWLLTAALVVAAVSLVIDGGRPAIAAGECQYGPYGPYGEQCAKTRPSLTTSPQQPQAELGWFLSDAATLSGGDNPTGTLSYRLHPPSDPTCSMGRFFFTVSVSGNRTYFSWESPFFVDWSNLDEVGTWRWTVDYSGDTRNEPATSGCAEEPVTVRLRTAFVSIFNSSFQVPVGSSLFGFVSTSGFRMTGTVQLRVYPPSDPSCSGPASFTQSFQLSGGFGEGFSFATGTVDEVGTWRYQVTYPGDARNTPASVSCGSVVTNVHKASPSLFTSPFNASAVIGTEVRADAALSGSFRPTGTLRFLLFAPTDSGCSSPVETKLVPVDPNGNYVNASFTPTAVGRWRITVDYAGDALNFGASAGCGSINVDVAKATPSLSPVSIPTQAQSGDRIGAWALMHGGYQPTGRVLLRLFAPGDTGCAGVPAHVEEALLVDRTGGTTAGFELPRGSEGTWNWTVSYLGDERNESTATGCGHAPVTVVAKAPSPLPSTAPPFQTNLYFNCLGDHNIGVPFGSRLVLQLGWGATTERQVRQFLGGMDTRFVMDGMVVSADRYWSKPFFNADAGLWVTRWTFDTGRVARPGIQAYAFQWENVATKTITDGVDTWHAGDVLASTNGPCLVDGFQP